MKILDATAVIAFLSELDYPEGLVKIATRHEVLIPRAVSDEITRPSTRGRLEALIRGQAVTVVDCPSEKVGKVRAENPQLGPGECAVLVLGEESRPAAAVFLVSDDRKARQKFPQRQWVWTEQLLDYMLERSLITSPVHQALIARLERSTFYSSRRRDGTRPSDNKPVRR